jgi:DNA primase
VKDFAGRLFGFVGRDVTGRSEKKVKNYYGIKTDRLILGEERILPTRPTILQEGPMGWLSLISNNAEKYANVVATFGSYLSPAQRDILAAHGNPVILLYDLDAAGDIGIYGKVAKGKKVLEGALETLEKHLPTVVGEYPHDVDDVDKMKERHIAEIVNSAWRI